MLVLLRRAVESPKKTEVRVTNAEQVNYRAPSPTSGGGGRRGAAHGEARGFCFCVALKRRRKCGHSQNHVEVSQATGAQPKVELIHVWFQCNYRYVMTKALQFEEFTKRWKNFGFPKGRHSHTTLVAGLMKLM